jgi:hypothetical protein
MTKEEWRSYWADRVVEFKASGQSVPAWCAVHDVKIHQMRYWLKRDKLASAEKTSSWLPLDLSEAGLQNALLVRVGKVAVEVRPGFDPKLLADVVKTLMAQ